MYPQTIAVTKLIKLTPKYALISEEISMKAASPILDINVATNAPKLTLFFTYSVISIMLPPHPGIIPRIAPIIGCILLFLSKISTIFPPVL